MTSRERRRAGDVIELLVFTVVGIIIVCFVVVLGMVIAHARDNGQWAQAAPNIRQWFNNLQSGKGLCCSFADGQTVEDPDWRHTTAGGYQVYYQGKWLDVPPEAVVGGGNRVGHAILWPSPLDPKSIIRCFLPGAEG